ncbi:hypothetical protein NDN08_004637 [Rhodosorus marinus]|uniref:CRC domain-containing protein n=1 Tax=Rhodosorus marinus TaxID=101924 RepID=A0AAV8ULX4_9RHOD|nr:hypothetical protein NDN08_004637 [Rhodosorus marinus]
MLYGEALAEFGENSRGSWGLNHVDEGTSGCLKVTSLMDKNSKRERRSSGGRRSGFGSYASEQAILEDWMSCGPAAREAHSTPRIVHHWEFGTLSSEESRFHGFSGPLHSKATELKVRSTRYGSSSMPRSSTLGSGSSKSFLASKLTLGKPANGSRNKIRSAHPAPKFPGSREKSLPQSTSTLAGLEGEPGVRVKELKPCNCSKSKCLKLYCECFAAGKTCGPQCKCLNCTNTPDHADEIDRARKSALDRNPHAFTPKIEMDGGVLVTRSKGVIRGCRCRKSGCLKGYCECYQAKVPCSHFCVCMECQNKAAGPIRPPKPPQSEPSTRTIVT